MVRRAAADDSWAWNELVRRYGAMVHAVARRYGLNAADTAEVVQTTWLKLVENITLIRQPERVSGWLATTASRECLRTIRNAGRAVPAAGEMFEELPDGDTEEVDARTIGEERRQVLRAAFARLPDRDQRLLHLLFADPAMSYRDLSRVLGMPTGSIGPTRGRCLAHLRELVMEIDASVA